MMRTNDNQHIASRGVEGRRPPRRKVVDLSFEQHTSFGEWIYQSAPSIIIVVLSLVVFLLTMLLVRFNVEKHPPLVLVEVQMETDDIVESEPEQMQEPPTESFEDLPDLRNQINNEVRNLQSNASASESGGQQSLFDDAEISSMMEQVEGHTKYSVEDSGGTSESSTPGSGGWGKGTGYGEGEGNGKGNGKGDVNFNGRVTVSYKFENPVRNARGQLYAPAYRAEHNGTVVVTVTLDRNGSVKSAYVSTSSGIKSLDDEALRAAKHSRTVFNIDSSAPERHRGTITYVFIAQ